MAKKFMSGGRVEVYCRQFLLSFSLDECKPVTYVALKITPAVYINDSNDMNRNSWQVYRLLGPLHGLYDPH
jgi:hypothetical protein